MSDTVIKFENFGFKYKVQKKPTLYDINLEIHEGEKILILGASGSGKSTLVNCINGLIPFSFEGEITGSLTVKGKQTKETSIFELSKSVGTVLQDSNAQFVGLSVGEDIAFALENVNTPYAEMVPIVNERASVVGMREFVEAVPFELSGGQKQKVAIAGVMGNDVNIFVFDEPLASLDPQMGMTAVALIDDLAKDKNRTIIIIEHRLEDVLYRPVDRVILMDGGSIVADMTPEELIRSSLLAEKGIREPLYITAMKYAGCNLAECKNLQNLESMELSSDARDKLTSFFARKTVSAPEPQNAPVLDFSDVWYAYSGEDYVLKDVSFTVNRGERIAVIGKNGAGKSTTARVICGISRPKKGVVRINGNDYSALSVKEIGELVGYVMQNPAQMLIKDIIKSEVSLALDIRKVKTEVKEEKVQKALEATNLWKMRNWPVDAVSYGQKKRVTVAAILALEPEIIILDEPTAGQDYRNYTEIMEFINELNKTYGKTILFITHDMHLALENTDRAMVFADGELIADDKTFAVLSNDEVIARANLKQTSLYRLAVKLGLMPEAVIRHFIEYERMVKTDE